MVREVSTALSWVPRAEDVSKLFCTNKTASSFGTQRYQQSRGRGLTCLLLLFKGKRPRARTRQGQKQQTHKQPTLGRRHISLSVSRARNRSSFQNQSGDSTKEPHPGPYLRFPVARFTATIFPSMLNGGSRFCKIFTTRRAS